MAVTCQDGDVNLDHVFVCGHPALDFAAFVAHAPRVRTVWLEGDRTVG